MQLVIPSSSYMRHQLRQSFEAPGITEVCRHLISTAPHVPNTTTVLTWRQPAVCVQAARQLWCCWTCSASTHKQSCITTSTCMSAAVMALPCPAQYAVHSSYHNKVCITTHMHALVNQLACRCAAHRWLCKTHSCSLPPCPDKLYQLHAAIKMDHTYLAPSSAAAAAVACVVAAAFWTVAYRPFVSTSSDVFGSNDNPRLLCISAQEAKANGTSCAGRVVGFVRGEL